MRQAVLAACASAVLGGCASASYVMKTYGDVDLVSFKASTGETFRVFDKPAENRLMITESLAAGMGRGLLSGATFGIVNASGPGLKHEIAGIEYLTSTGRNCVARRNSEIIKGQYEIDYECTS